MEGTASEALSIARQAGPRASIWQIAGVVAGNSLEFYDFAVFAYFAVYIGQAFFPSSNAAASLLASLATFGVGFITRPIGAFFIGRMGDRAGRKPAMLLSFALMGAASLGLALTPPASRIGLAAPFLVILFRLAQGFALGGEVGPSTSYLIEVAPPLQRGTYVSLQYLGQALSGLLAALVGVALSSLMGERGLRDYGWRIAMLLGVLIVPFGLAMRRTLTETLHEPESGPTRQTVGGPSRPFRAALIPLVLLSAGTTISYVLKYLTTYAIATLHMSPRVAFTGDHCAGGLGVALNPVGGWLSDRFGRKPVMIWPWIGLLIAIVPCYGLLAHYRTPEALFAISAVAGAIGTISGSVTLTAITESFPKHARSVRLAFIYALAISVFGGTAQFNVAWLTLKTHSAMVPAWYMMAGVAIGLVAMAFLPESAPIKSGAGLNRKQAP
jgi:MHS family citrate/tricarballylate:H+ symporter-like MFS transporter